MAKKNQPDKTSDRMAKYLAKFDFKMLKEQKQTLLKIQAKMEKPNSKFSQKEWDTIEGMLALCDSIQDIAVDEYGYNKYKVFRLSRKDN